MERDLHAIMHIIACSGIIWGAIGAGEGATPEITFWSGRRSIATDLRDHLRPEAIGPCPGRLVAHRHTAFSQQVLNVPQAQVEPVIAPDRVRDHRAGKAVPL